VPAGLFPLERMRFIQAGRFNFKGSDSLINGPLMVLKVVDFKESDPLRRANDVGEY
jgi:hypothetical protein